MCMSINKFNDIIATETNNSIFWGILPMIEYSTEYYSWKCLIRSSIIKF